MGIKSASGGNLHTALPGSILCAARNTSGITWATTCTVCAAPRPPRVSPHPRLSPAVWITVTPEVYTPAALNHNALHFLGVFAICTSLYSWGEVFFPKQGQCHVTKKGSSSVCGVGCVVMAALHGARQALCNGLFGFSWIAAVRPQCFLEHSKVPLAAAQHFPWWSSSLGVFATCANRAGQLPRTLPRSARARSHLPRTSRALSMSQVFSRPHG